MSRPLAGHQACLVVLFFVLWTVALGLPCAAQYTAPTISVTEPDGISDRVPGAIDYAEKILMDPWDMAQETDFHYFINQFGESGFTESGGDTVWTGVSLPTPETSDPADWSDCSIIILHPGGESALNVGRKGINDPIDASTYRYLSFRMYVSETVETQLHWYNHVIRNPHQDGDISTSDFFWAYEGWQVYTLDLANLPMHFQNTGPTWGGTVYGLRLDPSNLAGVRVTIDWIRLHSAATGANSKTIQWNHTDPNNQARVSLFASRESQLGRGFDAVYEVAASAIDATPGSYAWNMGHLPGEQFNIFALVGEEYASVVLNDPWDMSQETDIAETVNVNQVSFSNGILSCRSTSSHPQIEFHVSDRRPAGDRYPIKAGTFPIISFRMYLSEANKFMVLFRREGETTWESIERRDAYPGWQTYENIDMRESSAWTGNIVELRIEPTTLAPPVDIRFDWVTLNTTNSSTEGDDTTDLSLSPGPVSVNHAPTIRFKAPYWDSGADFATTVLGDPWDLAQPSDLMDYEYLTDVSFSEAWGLTATTTDWDSFLLFRDLTGEAVDADYYKTLSFDMWLDQPIADPADTGADVLRYDVARTLFRTGHDVNQSCTDDLVLYFGYDDHPTIAGLRSQDRSGWIRYHLYLPDARLEPVSDVFDDYPWAGDEGWFRFDPSEYGRFIGGGRTFHLKNVTLTADDESSTGEYVIRWADSDPDDNARINFYYDENDSGFDGEEINESPIYENVGGGDGSYTWQTGGIAEGLYWIHASITDTDGSADAAEIYAPRPIYIHYTDVPDTAPPYLADQYPPPGSVGASPYTQIMAHVRDDYSGPDPETVTMEVDGEEVTPAISGGGRDLVLDYDPPGTLDFGQTLTVRITAVDQAADPHSMDDSYDFQVTSSQDSDGDGLPDEWETMNGLDPGRGNGDEDADGDGQSNRDEYEGGTDPTSPALILAAPGLAEDNPPEGRGYYTDGAPVDWLQFTAYGVSAWGLNLVGGGIDGDGMDEIITGPGPGAVFGPHVRGWKMADDTVAAMPQVSFLAYGTSKFGVNVACGDVDGDGMDEIITGPGPGEVFGPHVRGWNYDGSAVNAIAAISYFAYGTPKFGVNVTCGDIDGDGYDEIVTGAGPGEVYGAHVRGWNYDNTAISAIPAVSFLAYGTQQWGVNVACGDIDGDGIDEIITGPGPGPVFGPHVRGWNVDGGQATKISQVSFFAFDASEWGVNVACGDFDGDGIDEIVTGLGPGSTFTTDVRAFNWDGSGAATQMDNADFRAFDASVTYGAKVGAVRLGD